MASSASSKSVTILDRAPLASPLTSSQLKVDHAVGEFTQQATDPRTLAAMAGAGLAGRLTRLGVMTGATTLVPEGGVVSSLLVRGSAYGLGLAGESAAFTGIRRGFMLADGVVPTQSFGKEWMSSAVSLGTLQFFGKLGEGQNPLVRHLMADFGMVGGHELASLVRLEEKPEGDLFTRFLEAEAMNWQMKAGMGLLYSFSPRLAALERALDLSFKAREGELGLRMKFLLSSLAVNALKEANQEAPENMNPEEAAQRRARLSWLGISLGLGAFFTPESAFAADGSTGGSSFSNLLIQAMMVGFVIWGAGMVFQHVRNRYFGGGKPESEAMKFGKIEAKLYERGKGVTFKDVAGADEAKEELKEIADYLKDPTSFIEAGANIPKGVLLMGPPGTGKTYLAKALATEAGVPFFSISGSQFVEMFVGVGASRIRDLFKQAGKKAPCIIFIDELDAIGRARSSGAGTVSTQQETEQTLNQLLVEMDGFDTGNNGIVIVAATNRPEILDSALLRPGRFDRHITVDKPDLKGRIEILKVHVRGRKLAQDVDLETIARRTPGFPGADLANVVNEAALLSARAKNGGVLTREIFERALDRVITGVEKKGQILSPEEKERTSIHEIGHTLPAMLLEHADPVHKVSIIPRGIGALGFTMQIPEQDRKLLTQSQLETKLAILLGGRIAEELILGEPSTGARDDLEKATEIASDMVKKYGMSKMGLMSFKENRSAFLEAAGVSPKSYSEKTAEEIDQEIKRIIQAQADRVRQFLTEHLDLLKFVSGRLLEVETLERPELEGMVRPRVKSNGHSSPKKPSPNGGLVRASQ